jgi:hypothetical protein
VYLTELQAHSRGKRRRSSGFWPVTTVVCLVLLALLAVVQVAHLHTDQAAADHCPLCIVMHSAAPVTVAAAIVVLVQVGTSTLQQEPVWALRKPQTRLFIRPPPVAV